MSPPSGCPMHKPEADPPPACPMHRGNGNQPVTDALNQANMIPNLSQERAEGQQTYLPTERAISSIPKSETSSKWEYPSPQQFYNALKRKGWETPEEEIETMVEIHNFLNEEAWQEVLKWESMHECPCSEGPFLARFQGRPKEMSPKARFYSTFFGAPKPFDRHDWIVDRCGKDVRYVIDYYEAPEEVPGVPVFHLDVRPALDSFESIVTRMKVGFMESMKSWFGNETGASTSAAKEA